jgi:hypothetical protein
MPGCLCSHQSRSVQSQARCDAAHRHAGRTMILPWSAPEIDFSVISCAPESEESPVDFALLRSLEVTGDSVGIFGRSPIPRHPADRTRPAQCRILLNSKQSPHAFLRPPEIFLQHNPFGALCVIGFIAPWRQPCGYPRTRFVCKKHVPGFMTD